MEKETEKSDIFKPIERSLLNDLTNTTCPRYRRPAADRILVFRSQ